MAPFLTMVFRMKRMGAGSAFTEGVFQMLEAEKAMGWREKERH